MNILQSFREIEYFSGAGGQRAPQIMEREGQQPEFVYWIIQGEVHLYKKLLETNKAHIELYNNPNQDNLEKDIGVCIGKLSAGDTLAAEDAVLFQKKM